MSTPGAVRIALISDRSQCTSPARRECPRGSGRVLRLDLTLAATLLHDPRMNSRLSRNLERLQSLPGDSWMNCAYTLPVNFICRFNANAECSRRENPVFLSPHRMCRLRRQPSKAMSVMREDCLFFRGVSQFDTTSVSSSLHSACAYQKLQRQLDWCWPRKQ